MPPSLMELCASIRTRSDDSVSEKHAAELPRRHPSASIEAARRWLAMCARASGEPAPWRGRFERAGLAAAPRHATVPRVRRRGGRRGSSIRADRRSPTSSFSFGDRGRARARHRCAADSLSMAALAAWGGCDLELHGAQQRARRCGSRRQCASRSPPTQDRRVSARAHDRRRERRVPHVTGYTRQMRAAGWPSPINRKT